MIYSFGQNEVKPGPILLLRPGRPAMLDKSVCVFVLLPSVVLEPSMDKGAGGRVAANRIPFHYPPVFSFFWRRKAKDLGLFSKPSFQSLGKEKVTTCVT